MTKQLNITQLFVNILIALASVVWLVPFFGFLVFLLEFIREMETGLAVHKDYFPQGPPFSNIAMSQWFLAVSAICIGVTIAVWIFVLLNRLWPIMRDRSE